MTVDSCVQVDYAGKRSLIYNSIVQDAVAQNLSALTPYRYPQSHPFLDFEIPCEDLLEFDKAGIGVYFRQKTEASQIDSDDRNGSVFDETRNAQEGPVSTDHNNRFDCIRYVYFVITAAYPRVIDILLKKNIYVALLEPLFDLPGELGGFRARAFINYRDMSHFGPPQLLTVQPQTSDRIKGLSKSSCCSNLHGCMAVQKMPIGLIYGRVKVICRAVLGWKMILLIRFFHPAEVVNEA
jgi:hypothetical protein